jgi:hypothetical protein
VKTEAGYRVAPIAELAGADAWVVRVYPERKAALLSYRGRGERQGYSWWSLVDSRELGSVPAKLKKAVPVSASPSFGAGWILINERTIGLRKKSHLRLLTAEPFAEIDYTEFPGHLRLLLPSAESDCVYVSHDSGISVACPPDEQCDECTITIKNAGLCDLGCNAYAWGPALYEYDEATGHETIRYIGSHRSEGQVAWEAVLKAGDRNGDSDFSQSADGTMLAVYSPEGWVSIYALEPEGIERIHSVRVLWQDGTLAIREDAGVPDLVEQVGKSPAGELGDNSGRL